MQKVVMQEIKEIKSLGFDKYKIEVADKLDLSKVEIFNVENMTEFSPPISHVLKRTDFSDCFRANIVLQCYIGDLLHYGITVDDGSDVKLQLINSEVFNKHYAKEL